MSQSLEIVNVVLPVFLVIGLGYALGRSGFLTGEVTAGLSRFVFWVAAPALLFRSVAITDLGRPVGAESLGGVLMDSVFVTFLVKVVGIAALASVVTAFVAYMVGGRLGPSRRGVVAQGAYRSNMVFVGFPVIVGLYGDDILGPAAVFVAFMAPVYNVLAVVVLALPHSGADAGRTLRRTVRDIATNPLIISCALGIDWSALGFKLPSTMDVSLDLVGRIAMPLALVVVGASIEVSKLRKGAGLPLLVSMVKLIIYPALICAGLWAAGISGEPLGLTVLMMAAPTAVVSHIMAREMKGDEQLAGQIVIATTLCSLITLSGWLAFFKFIGD